MSFTYPIRHHEGPVTPEQLKLLLGNKTLVARRIAELTREKFIADYLLTGRYDAQGGGVFYDTETGELYTGEDPEAIEPAGEYPLVHLDEGVPSAARTVKWGQGTRFTDEKITREGRQYVDRGLARVGNTIVRHVDGVAWGVISSKVTSTRAASATWDKAGVMMRDILSVQNERAELATGIELDTVALSGDQFANLIGLLVDDKALPREQANIVLTGNVPVNALGLTWVTSPHIVGDDPWLFDRDQLGGMADEKLISEEFASAGPQGVEAATERVKGVDAYEVRARRVTVPVVVEPNAGVRLTGTGL